jgi:hypothetical protein
LARIQLPQDILLRRDTGSALGVQITDPGSGDHHH